MRDRSEPTKETEREVEPTPSSRARAIGTPRLLPPARRPSPLQLDRVLDVRPLDGPSNASYLETHEGVLEAIADMRGIARTVEVLLATTLEEARPRRRSWGSALDEAPAAWSCARPPGPRLDRHVLPVFLSFVGALSAELAAGARRRAAEIAVRSSATPGGLGLVRPANSDIVGDRPGGGRGLAADLLGDGVAALDHEGGPRADRGPRPVYVGHHPVVGAPLFRREAAAHVAALVVEVADVRVLLPGPRARRPAAVRASSVEVIEVPTNSVADGRRVGVVEVGLEVAQPSWRASRR